LLPLLTLPSTARRTFSQGAGGPVGFAAQYSASGFDSRPQAIHGLLKPDRTTHTLWVFRKSQFQIATSVLHRKSTRKATSADQETRHAHEDHEAACLRDRFERARDGLLKPNRTTHTLWVFRKSQFQIATSVLHPSPAREGLSRRDQKL